MHMVYSIVLFDIGSLKRLQLLHVVNTYVHIELSSAEQRWCSILLRNESLSFCRRDLECVSFGNINACHVTVHVVCTHSIDAMSSCFVSLLVKWSW